eukprot:Rhum_TRINITY_DN22887_c0_g1::Rhum_TRINITY_DN22887_c0_g1_i1::g.176348::m.176348
MADAVDSGALKVVFDQIDGLLESASADEAQRVHNKQLLLKEFGAFFKMKVDSGAAEVEDMWEPVETMSEESWRVSNGGQKVTMSASAGWRSIITRAPIGTPDQEQVFITIQPHALRILTVGLAVDRPEKYVGDSSSSYGYQSTGHMLCDGIAVTQQTSPSFEKGDTIGILLDQKQKYIAFYKNTQMAGVPFMDVDVSKGFKLVISCYMGPCSCSVDLAPIVSGQIKQMKTFPVCIQHIE